MKDGELVTPFSPITPHQAHHYSHLAIFSLLLLSQFTWPTGPVWERGWKATEPSRNCSGELPREGHLNMLEGRLHEQPTFLVREE